MAGQQRPMWPDRGPDRRYNISMTHVNHDGLLRCLLYTMYLKEKRNQLQLTHPSLKPKEIISMLASEWRNLSELEKLAEQVEKEI